MAKCSFCAEQIELGTGMMYVKADATVLNFCSSKCRKNLLKLGRKAIHVKWTKQYKR